jgi:hypothetical protein
MKKLVHVFWDIPRLHHKREVSDLLASLVSAFAVDLERLQAFRRSA